DLGQRTRERPQHPGWREVGRRRAVPAQIGVAVGGVGAAVKTWWWCDRRLASGAGRCRALRGGRMGHARRGGSGSRRCGVQLAYLLPLVARAWMVLIADPAIRCRALVDRAGT